MWEKIDLNLMNIEVNKWYETSLHLNGEIRNKKRMKFKQGLWWTDDVTYTHYQPSHVWV